MVIGDAGNTAVFGPIGHGGAERMIVYPAMLWMMAFGGYLMADPTLSESRLSRRPDRDERPQRHVRRREGADRRATRDHALVVASLEAHRAESG